MIDLTRFWPERQLAGQKLEADWFVHHDVNDSRSDRGLN